ncbi:MAG: hypothetical protein E6J59_11080, partial [Deltaproteobacteria bacterium]
MMSETTSSRGARPRAAMLGLLAMLAAQAATASAVSPDTASASSPNFDAVAWIPLTCDNRDLISHTSPAAVDFAGDATFSPAYLAHDDGFLYLRYRMDADPSTFVQYSWTALMQVPSGDPFQYQYQLSLNGKTNTIEIWKNTIAQDISFSPLFRDGSEVQLFSQDYHLASTANTTPLARIVSTTDGSYFDGDADYFVEFAFPVSVMVTNGLIASAADLDRSLFFPATATDPNNYNKGHLNCTFIPAATLSVDVTIRPDQVPVNVTTPVEFTIAVHNDGVGAAKGIIIDNSAFPPYLSNVMVRVFSDDPSVTATETQTNPLEVKVPSLLPGATLTIQVMGDARPGCVDSDYTDVATASAVNAMPTTGSAVLHIQRANAEVCDGVDNNCDGQIDEGGSALCDDGNPCNGAETCGGAAGCQPGTPPSCDDGNACTVDGCDPQSGCTHDPIPGCVPCTTAADCNDGNACTTDTCDAGACAHDPIPGCVSCITAADCDDGNACSTDTCDAGACAHTTIPGCVPCTTAADCGDGNACTTDTCDAGACAHAPIPGCVPCATAADCNDGSACTTDSCDAGACTHATIPGCVGCATATDCNDGNACTTDTCDAGACGHATIPGCVLCATAADCGDGTACTT